MIKIDVLIQNKIWKKYISSPEKYINKKTRYLYKHIPIMKNKNINLSLLLSGPKEIKYLNKKFRKKNKITDVLSFPFYSQNNINKKIKNSKNLYLGDIILNHTKIKKKNFKAEFDKLWIHGFLHLLGYKHFKNKDFYKMNKLEKKIFKNIK
tara:strand:+ start:926 stop:1378 length:453 start_codon:yes stop_codon:yes gene_type:complete